MGTNQRETAVNNSNCLQEQDACFWSGFTDVVSDVVCVCVCVCVCGCQRMRQSASLHSPQSFLAVSSRCRRGRMEGSSFIS